MLIQRTRSILSLVVLIGFATLAMAGEPEGAKPPDEAKPKKPKEGNGLVKTANKSLNAALSTYALGKAESAGGLTVVPILVSAREKSHEKYLTLNEGLQRKLLTIKEVDKNGTVPTVEVVSSSDTPIFIPFGAVITGGKQDRMVREDVLLESKETRKIAVYCIEQGRWARSNPDHAFKASTQMGNQSLKALANSEAGQGVVWADVRKSNVLLGNSSMTSNFQGNALTPAFKKIAKELAPLRDNVAQQKNAAGAIVLLGGKVVGVEVFATASYFSKVWPQLFQSYVVDTPAAKEKGGMDPEEANHKAKELLARINSAQLTEKKLSDQIRVKIDDEKSLGYALIKSEKSRLIYLRFFPKTAKTVRKPGQGQQQQEQQINPFRERR